MSYEDSIESGGSDNSQLNLLGDSSYRLNKLVYINSAGHAYSEIPIKDHLALFGANNMGKTASMAGCKLALYPESSFRHCEKKFGFAGKNGLYSPEESYAFYFPSSSSFIALEVENPIGTFCMVLYKLQNYKYARAFVPVCYDTLREIFWDAEKHQFATSLDVKTLERFAKSNDGFCESDPSRIRELMFFSHRRNITESRYCVLPMKDSRVTSVDAFRSIYQLAFDTANVEQHMLPKAISTLFEMGKSRPQESLDADLKRLVDDHRELVEQRDWLQKLNNASDGYRDVERALENYASVERSHATAYEQLRQLVGSAEALDEAQKAANEAHKEYSKASHAAEKAIEDCNRDCSMAEGRIAEKKNSIEKHAQTIELAGSLLRKAGYSTVDEYSAAINAEIRQLKEEIEALESERTLQEWCAARLKEKNAIQINIARIRALLENDHSSLLHQLGNSESASALLSLNPSFTDINVNLDVDVKNTIAKFTALIGAAENGRLTFLGQPLGDSVWQEYNSDIHRATLDANLTAQTARLKQIDAQLQERKEADSPEDREKLISQKDRQRSALQRDHSTITGMQFAALRKEQEERELDALNDERQTKLIELEEHKTERNKLQKTLAEAHQRLQQITAQTNLMDKARQELERSLPSRSLVSSNEHAELDRSQVLTQDCIDSAGALREALARADSEVIVALSRLQRDLPHPDVDNHRIVNSASEARAIIEAYKNSYATLEYEQTRLNNETRSHNQLVNNQLMEMRDTGRALTSFIAELNQDLNKHKISNLSSVVLNVKFNKAFNDLVAEIDRIDIQDNSLLETRFYESLSSFVDKFFDKTTHKIRTADIIDKVSYGYTIGDSDRLETKSQSGGTTSTVTAFLMAVLLKRITPESVDLRIPIVVDEMSTLDGANKGAAANQVLQHGFSVFCATPDFSASLAKLMGRWVMIDAAYIDQPLVDGCHMNILPQHVESFGEKV